MKYFTRLLLLALVFTLANNAKTNAQCTQGVLYGSGTASATCATVTASFACHYINEYARFTGLTIGNTYEIGTNVPGMSSTTIATAGAHIMTLYNGSGVALDFLVNPTNNLMTITFVASTTEVRVQMNTYTGSVCGSTGSYCNYFGLRCTSCSGPGAPTCSTLSSPANNATGVSVLPTLSWSSAANATSYDVYLDADPTCSGVPATLIATVSTTSYTLVAPLSPSTKYRWMVIPRDCAGSAQPTCSANAFCFTTTVAPPANDNCPGAITLTPQPNAASCSSPLSATTVGATQSNTNCSATATNDDVWFTFTTGAGIGSQIIRFQNVAAVTGTVTSMGMDLYTVCGGSNTNCNTGVTLTSGAGQATLTGLTGNTTYFLRVWTAGTSNSATFDICAIDPPPPPSNDNICGAVSLTPSPGLTCTTALTGQSSQYANAGAAACAGSGADDDIWYSFVATSTSHIITLTNSGSGNSDRVHQVYSSSDNTCSGTLTSIKCSDPETSTTTGLTIGNTYFVRVHSYSTGNYATFDICVTTSPLPPSNDLCAGAIAITTGSSVTLNVTSATDETASTAPSCGGISTQTKGVWYVFTAPAGSSGTVTLSGCDTDYDMRVRVYTGVCGSLVCLTGDDNDDCNGPGSGLAETTVFTVTQNAAPVNYYICITGPGNNLSFSIASVLPIELKSFSGKAMEHSNMLSWITSSEKNVQWHVVERSFTGVDNWLEVGKKVGAGNTQSEQKYELEDRAPASKAYYRIRTIDFDGAEQVSNTVSITRKNDRFGITAAFPNPATDLLNLQFNTTEEGNVTIQVVDFTGKLVFEQTTEAVKGANLFPVQLGQLSAGTYTIHILNGVSSADPVRFVKQ